MEYVRIGFIGGGALDGSPFATPWRQTSRAVLLDLGPHTLDLAEAVAGPIVELRATESGAVAIVTTTHQSGASGHVVVSGTTPNAVGPLEAEGVTDSGRALLEDPTPTERASCSARLPKDFARTIRGEIDQPLDVHRGVRLQQLIAAVAYSLDTATAVTL